MSAASPKRAFSEGIEHAVERIVSERVVGDRLRVRHIGIRRLRLCDLHSPDARADGHERALEEVFRNANSGREPAQDGGVVVEFGLGRVLGYHVADFVARG